MRERDTLEGKIAALEREVQDLKTPQPFADGQLGMILNQSAAAYDFSLTANWNSKRYVRGIVRFVNDSGQVPFCVVTPVISDTSGVQRDASIISQLYAARRRKPYLPGKVVEWEYRYRVGNPAYGTQPMYIKYFAVSNDRGSFIIDSSDWWVEL